MVLITETDFRDMKDHVAQGTSIAARATCVDAQGLHAEDDDPAEFGRRSVRHSPHHPEETKDKADERSEQNGAGSDE